MKLNLGGGKIPLEGYENVDRCVGKEVFPLDYPDNSADEIRASHVLEHFSKRDAIAAVKEWVRVLKPGGTIKIAVPDMGWIMSNPEHQHFEGYIYGGQTDENDFHKSAWNDAKLRELFKLCGLVEVFPWKSELQDCAALPVSLNLMARKPGPVAAIDPRAVRVCGLMSAPRLQFGDTWGCISSITSAFGIPMKQRKGAFWEQCLQNLFLDAIAEDYEFAFTVDYDSTFTMRHFRTLLQYIVQNPGVDAVAPFQPMRGKRDTVLCATDDMADNGAASVALDKPIEAKFAHFGLTFFRLSAIKALPLPWLHSQPGRTGLWDYADGAIDADAYFWAKFKKEGRSVHVLPWVRIGHIETMISEFDPVKGRTEYVHSKDWMNKTFVEG